MMVIGTWAELQPFSPPHFWDYSSVQKEENIPDVVCVVILIVSKHWARVTPHRQKWNIQYQDMEMELEF